jgi:ankyrin repeat protein
MVQFLLDGGAHVETENMFGATPLLFAVFGHHTSIASLLLDRGANIKARHKNVNENVALHTAASLGDTRMIKLLLDRGADIEVKNNNGSTPLLLAVASAHTDRIQVTRLLLDRGANMDTRDDAGRTALHIAARDSVTTVSLLLDRGADVNVADNQMKTPLHHAADERQQEIYQLLKDHRADEYARDRYGRSAKAWMERPESPPSSTVGSMV